MEIKASYFAALFALAYFGVGVFIIYFFRKRYTGRFGGQGYKFPAIIYFISIPIIVAIGTDFFSNYDGDAIYDLTPSLDFQFAIGIFIFAVIPTLVYLGVGIYILSLEHLKGKKGYKGPAIIYFISVPTLIVIAITIHFMMNYTTGRFEATNKPAGYELYKFLVLKDIIPRSGQSLDKEKTTQSAKVIDTESTQTVKVKFNEVDLKNKKKLKFKEYGPFYGIKKNGIMVRGIHKGLKGEDAQTDYYGLFTKNNMYWKGYSKHTYKDGKVLYQYNEYKLDDKGNPIQDKDGIFQLVDSYLISADSFEKVKEYIHYDIELPFSFYNFEEPQTQIAKKETTQTQKVAKKYCLFKPIDGGEKLRSHKNITMDVKADCPKPFVAGKWIEITYADYKKFNDIKDPKIKLEMAAKVFHPTYSNSGQTTTFSIYSEIKLIDPNESQNFNRFFKDVFSKTLSKCKKMNKTFTDGECKISSIKFYNLNDEMDNKTFTNSEGFVNDATWNDILFNKTNKIAKEPTKGLIGTFKTDEKYYALIIGNNNYEHLEKLDAAQNDAKVLANVLQDKYGFEVDLLLNADYDTTVNSLYKITNKLKSNDNLLIYYAGHGELEKAENRGYWLPVDASYELRSKWISNQRIVDRVKATKAKHVLLMVDSCFSGTLMRSGTTPDVKEIIDEKYIERLKKKKTRLVITSGGNEPVVDSDGGQHSLFALKLIDTLKNSNSVINSQTLFENIRRYVISNADQTPERAMVHKTGHDGGDFLFFAKN